MTSVCGEQVLLDHLSVSESGNGDRLATVRFHTLADLRTFVLGARALKLWGRHASVEAPNCPELVRCSGCGEIGHRSNSCPKYDGIVVRFVFRVPVPEARRRDIERVAGASSVYTGLESTGSAKRPNPMVHCVYPDTKALEAGVLAVRREFGGLLAKPPTLSDPSRRARECSECGDAGHRSSACTLMVQPQRPATLAAVVAAGAGLGAQPSSSSEPNLCFRWRDFGHCRSKGKCKFEHPAERQGNPNVCFAWRDGDQCRRGSSCKFQHSLVPLLEAAQPIQPVSVVEPHEVEMEEEGVKESAGASQDEPASPEPTSLPSPLVAAQAAPSTSRTGPVQGQSKRVREQSSSPRPRADSDSDTDIYATQPSPEPDQSRLPRTPAKKAKSRSANAGSEPTAVPPSSLFALRPADATATRPLSQSQGRKGSVVSSSQQ